MKKSHKILLGIFILTLATRLFLAFYIPNFTYESYFNLRHVEHITNSGLPLYEDPLSYGGRTLVFLPAFHYVASFFDLFLPLEIMAKIFSNLLFASLIFFVYVISKKITKREDSSLLAAFISAFIPIFWKTNSFSPYCLFLPIAMLATYSLMNLRNKKFVYVYLVSIIFLSLMTSATFLLIIGLLFYLLLSRLEEKIIPKAELELTIFSLFLFLWLQFLFFKDILISEGPYFIWENIPSQILSQYFPKLSVLHSLILVGIIPLISGIYIVYKSLFEEKNKNIFLLFSFVVSTVVLLILGLVKLNVALLFLGLLLAILFSQFHKIFLQYLKKTKLIKLKNYALMTIIFLVIVTSIYPSIAHSLSQQTPTNVEIRSFVWLREHTSKNSVVLASLKEGNLISYVSQRKNVMDDQFSLIKDVETHFKNLNSLYTTKYKTEAITLLNKYQIDYMFLSPKTKEEYDIDTLPYRDEQCFVLIHEREAQIYESKCKLKIIEK